LSNYIELVTKANRGRYGISTLITISLPSSGVNTYSESSIPGNKLINLYS
jgi:hypothetical protein